MSRKFYSKPEYASVTAKTGHPHHLLIADSDGLSRALQLRAEIPGPTTLLLVRDADDDNTLAGDDVQTASPQALTTRLNQHLAVLPAGTVCYLFGREAFIWPIATQLQTLGVQRSNCLPERCGPLVRDVVCVHCKQHNTNVAENMLTCGGCGRLLWSYDHFSRRLGAYMGFEVNAECPNEAPPREPLRS